MSLPLSKDSKAEREQLQSNYKVPGTREDLSLCAAFF